MPDSDAVFAAFEATWPPANRTQIGPFTYRDGAGGGSRVSAATLDGAFTPEALRLIEARFARDGRDALFQIRTDETAFDQELARRGYRAFDPVACLSCHLNSSSALLPAADPTMGYMTWPPIAIQREIWAEGGIGATRLAVMERGAGPKSSVLGRLNDTPAGACFIAIHQGIAALHALEVSPTARRHGLGRAMMALAVDWARRQGAETLALQVTRANQGALALYSSLGMTEVGQYHYRTKPVSEAP
ncbi:GNAT family N-acetyltransferase [Celeribacter neptunius]|uniref:Acetyltransferase (GNAT) family protein n=1 Tax=Celeribacter neptunius TaxID=588602 RepID=A0A1I3WZA7_9RHOB|nr:GNAT family N-acetyltransferase [Celeribacter neptunius]SFK11936.1 Acetyltransferase (GNAT) family protein [Celeribacter neptunius]